MMKTILQKAALLIAGVSFAAITHATVITVSVTNFSFSPASFTANVGDTVMWMWSAGTHTTTSLTVPAGAATWNNPMTSSSPMFNYVITQPGSYTYWCAIHKTAMEGSFTVNVAGVPNISNLVSDYVTVFPNPVSGVLNMHLKAGSDNEELIIADMQGREMIRQNPASTDNAFNVSTWPKGVYFYSLKRKEQMLNGKFEVQ